MALAVTVTAGPTSNGPKRVVQRTRIGGGAGGVVVNGSFSGATLGYDFSLEARITQDGTGTEVVTWIPAKVKQLDGKAGTGTFELMFPGEVPIGGWYNLQFRASTRDTAAELANHTVKWGVGLVVFLIGQSNIVQVYTESSTPAAADAKVSLYANSSPASYSGTKTFEWVDLTSDAFGNGIHQFLNDLQAGATEDSSGLGDIPIGVVCAGVGGSALTPLGDWVDVGIWEKGDSTIYDAAQAMLQLATGGTKVEAVVWQQGEAEASKYADPADAGKWPTPGLYYNGLKNLYESLSQDLETPYSKLKMVFGGPCRNTQSWAQVIAPVSFVYATSRVNADLLKFVREDVANRGYVPAYRGALNSSGLHLSAAGAATMGGDLANSLMAIMGVATTNPRTKQGPRITGAYFGTEAAPDDRSKITLMVEHELGTSLTLGTDSSIPAFQVFDAEGPLAVTAAAVHSDGDKIELTLAANTDKTDANEAGVTTKYGRPNRLVGNWAAVKYACWPSLNPVFLIKDNATVAGYLQPTAKETTTENVPGMRVDDYKDQSEAFIKAKITASSAASGKTTVTIENEASRAQAAGATYRSSGRIPLQIKPGDRVTLHDVIGGYKEDAIVEEVVANTPNWQIKLTNDFLGASIVTTTSLEDRLFVNPEPESAGAILVRRRVATYLGFGGPDR